MISIPGNCLESLKQVNALPSVPWLAPPNSFPFPHFGHPWRPHPLHDWESLRGVCI